MRGFNRRCDGIIALAVVVIATSASCGGEQAPPPSAPAVVGAVTGALLVAGETRGLANSVVTLRRATGDSVRAMLTDSVGAFRFSSVPAATYRVAVRLPSGFHSNVVADTLQSVTVPAGGDAAVRFLAYPTTSVVDTLRAGESDTLALSNGASIVVRASLRSASIPVSLREATSDTASTGGRAAVGVSVVLSLPSTVSAGRATASLAGVGVTGDSALVTFSLPVTGLVPTGSVPIVAGTFNVVGSTQPFLQFLPSQLVSVGSAAGRAGASALVGQVSLPLASVNSIQLSVAASRVKCADEMTFARQPGFYGTTPLVLIHGVQLHLTDCDDYKTFEPARETFAPLIAYLQSLPSVRNAYALYVFKYPTSFGIANAARGLALANGLSALTSDGQSATIIAHSMGGLVARQYLHDQGSSGIAHVITLGTPHLGSAIADVGDAIWTPQASRCYDGKSGGLNGWLPPAWILRLAQKNVFQSSNSQGMMDLRSDHALFGGTERYGSLITAFEGAAVSPMLSHRTPSGIIANGILTLGSCYLAEIGQANNDGLVATASAAPAWVAHAWGPFARDHIQMQGSDDSDLSDSYAAVIGALMLPSTVTVTSNVSTTWSIASTGLSGAGISGAVSVSPAPSGTSYVLSPASIAGRSHVVTNSWGGGNAATLRPGQSVAFAINYSGAPPVMPGALVNGESRVGHIQTPGQEDAYTLSVPENGTLIVAVGRVDSTQSLWPWVRVYPQSGAAEYSVSDSITAVVVARFATGGLYRLVVGSRNRDFTNPSIGTGAYRIESLVVPGRFTVAAGDEGGSLRNAANHSGAIERGDVDSWTIDVAAGATLVASMGKLDSAGSLNPWIQVVDPKGRVLAESSEPTVARIQVTATEGGIHTVVAATQSRAFLDKHSGHGRYVLAAATAPDSAFTGLGDDGGALQRGVAVSGQITLGDVDVWTMDVAAPQLLDLRMRRTDPSSTLSPELLLLDPAGSRVASANALGADPSEAAIQQIAVRAGRYTVIVMSRSGAFADQFRGTGAYSLVWR